MATSTIVLSSGEEVIVDEADHEWLSRWKWKRHAQGYACRSGWDAARKKWVTRLMHRVILGDIPPGMTVDHINRDKRDNRRENLRIVTQGENNRNGGGRPPRRYPDEKVCEMCGATFVANPRKRKRQKTCSTVCARRLAGIRQSATKQAKKAA